MAVQLTLRFNEIIRVSGFSTVTKRDATVAKRDKRRFTRFLRSNMAVFLHPRTLFAHNRYSDLTALKPWCDR